MAKKQTKTEHLRSLFKAKIQRLRKSGIQVSQQVINFINTARYQTLNKYHKNRYDEFNKYINNLNSAGTIIPPYNPTNKTPSTDTDTDPFKLEERLQHLIDKGTVSPIDDIQREYYKSVIKYAREAPYGEVFEAKYNSKHPHHIEAELAYNWTLSDPEAFNDYFGKDVTPEPPTPTNTAPTSDLIYNSLQSLIDEAIMSANSGEAWLANKLQEMLQNEIEYAIQQCDGDRQQGYDKAMAAMDTADGFLLREAERFIYDSDGWTDEAWKGSLLSMATLIHGYIDDEIMEQVAVLDDLRDEIPQP